MKLFIKITLLVLALSIFTTSLYSKELTIHKLEERKFSKTGLSYIITANKKTINFEKLRKFNLFNRRKIVSEAMNYNNGTLFQKDFKVDFENAYFFEGNFYMQNCYATLKDGHIKSDYAVYKKEYVEFKKLVMKKNNKVYHKFKYILHITNK